jgi:hypothetical protein
MDISILGSKITLNIDELSLHSQPLSGIIKTTAYYFLLPNMDYIKLTKVQCPVARQRSFCGAAVGAAYKYSYSHLSIPCIRRFNDTSLFVHPCLKFLIIV